VKSITFETPTQPNDNFPDLSNDPFTPSSSLKPFPPPTPNLVELPTCPVCLDRMDDTTGLMTIPCQHVFHCSCLQNWKGSGCPVCRHTNPSQTTSYDPSNPYAKPFGSPVSNLCSVCDSTSDLWICLICGVVGCGRYKGGHAKDHWKETAHSFALELETQHVWDYAGDMWVHRLIRDKGDGKVVELPGHHRTGDHGEDVVPRAKLESIGLEYTHLLTSQLESQRVYYEDVVNKAVDKAIKAVAASDNDKAAMMTATEEVKALRAENTLLRKEVVPQLERDVEREKTQRAKAQDLARNLGRSLQEEKKVTEGLMKRVEHVNSSNESLEKKFTDMAAKIAELEEMNRDLTMFISGQEKLKELENEGKVEAGELAEGSVLVAEKKGKRKAKK
jgi:BRCA1-associated protein